MNKKPALRAEDGARLFGRIDAIEGGKCRVTIRAALHPPDHVDEEMPEHHVANDREEAFELISRRALERGFDKWTDESLT